MLRKRRRFHDNTVTDEEREEAKRKMRKSWALRASKDERKRKGYLLRYKGEIKAALEHFDVKKRRMYRILTEHEQYECEHCRKVPNFEDCSAEFFLDDRGRNSEINIESPRVKAVFEAVLDRKQTVQYGSGEEVEKERWFGIGFSEIYGIASQRCPDLTKRQVRWTLKRLQGSEYAELLALRSESEDDVRKNLAPKKNTRPLAVDESWILDDYDLDLFIWDDGKLIQAVLLYMFAPSIEPGDDYFVSWRVVPKRTYIDDQGKEKRCGPRSTDTGIMFATGVFRNNKRPLTLWNDHAGYFRSLCETINLMMDFDEEPMSMSDTAPGRSWTRGLLENKNNQLREFVSQYEGAYDPKRRGHQAKIRKDLMAKIREGNMEGILTAETATREFASYFNNLNTEQRYDKNGKPKPSRADIYSSVLPRGRPTIRQLATLPYPVPPVRKKVSMTHRGFWFLGELYVPVCENPEDVVTLYRHWMRSVYQTRTVNQESQIVAVLLDEFGWQVEIELTRDYWYRAIPRSEWRVSNKEHSRSINIVLAEMEIDARTALEAAIRDEQGKELPDIIHNNITRAYRVDENHAQQINTETDAQKDQKSKSREKSDKKSDLPPSSWQLDPNEFPDLES